MSDTSDNAASQFSVSDAREVRPRIEQSRIKAVQPEKGFEYSSAEAVRRALGKRACLL
jgi:hypothetical protein